MPLGAGDSGEPVSDPQPLNTQAERLAAAQAKQAAREQGIRAAAVKDGRKAERAEILATLGVQQIEDASQVAKLTAERDARPTKEEERKHVIGNRWRGRLEGMLVGIVFAAVLGSVALRLAFEQAALNAREMVITGAISQSVNEPQACLPGSTLPDGRQCPERQ